MKAKMKFKAGDSVSFTPYKGMTPRKGLIVDIDMRDRDYRVVYRDGSDTDTVWVAEKYMTKLRKSIGKVIAIDDELDAIIFNSVKSYIFAGCTKIPARKVFQIAKILETLKNK